MKTSASNTLIDFMVNKVKVSQYAVNPDDFEGLRDYLSTNSFLETALRSQSPMSILDLDLSLRSQIINAMTPQELHDLMVMQYGSTVNFANSVLLNDPCYNVMSLSILSGNYYNFAAALLNQANYIELLALWDFYFFPTPMPGDMFQVANDLFNTFDPDIYNKILALDGVKDNFFMTYELDFGFGSLETFLVNYSDFKLCTRNALGDAAIIGIFNLFDQTGLWDAMNSLHTWTELANKMIQYNPNAFLLAGLPYMPQYATTLLENGMYVEDPPSVMQPLYQISLEQFFDSIQSYPGLGEAYMLQLTNQLIALGYASPGWSYLVAEHHLYGSARLGVHQTKKELRNRYKQEEITVSSNTVNTTTLYRGKRNYELSNHLGNVQVVISDKRKSFCDEELGVERFEAEVLSGVDYYPFGKMLPDRQYYTSNDTNQFVNGFNGMRYDHDINQKGRSIDYGARILDVDLGRWLSLDPLKKKYPSLNPYNFVNNTPIQAIDPTGNDHFYLIWKTSHGDVGHVAIAVPTYEKNTDQAGNITFKATGTYTVYSLVPNSQPEPADVIRNPGEIISGHMRTQIPKNAEEMKKLEAGGEVVDVIYQIKSTPEEDQKFITFMEQYKSGIEIPQYGDDATPRYPNEIKYKIDGNGTSALNSDSYNCTSFAVIKGNSIYRNDQFYAGELVDIGEVTFGDRTSRYQGMIFTPGGLIDALESSGNATRIKGTPEHGPFVDTYSGGSIKDKNPDK